MTFIVPKLNKELILSLLNSEQEFPVDFESAWVWIGYSTKQKAKRKLENNFELGIDYEILLNHLVEQTGSGGHNREPIQLTTDCFKQQGKSISIRLDIRNQKNLMYCQRNKN